MLALKGNQGHRHEEVTQLFNHAQQQQFCSIDHDFYATQQQAHGRTEPRRYGVMGQTA